MRKMQKLILSMTSSLVVIPSLASAQVMPIPYDDISYFEEPNRFELPFGTLSTNVLLDQTVNYGVLNNEDTYQSEAIGRVSLEGQLENTTVIGAQYAVHGFRTARQRYRDQLQVYARDQWGTLALGNVAYGVRQDTRRRQGIGHAQLVADDFYGNLDQDAIYYRYGSRGTTASIAVDRQGRGEIGVNMSRPMDESLYRLSARVRRGDTTDRDQFDAVPSANLLGRDPATSYGTAVVGGYTYGSFTADLQLGYERLNLKRSTREANRYFSSAGLYHKTGAFSTSWEAMLGRYDGHREFSSAVGFRVDLARGWNINFGHNYTNYLKVDNSTFFGSMCYEF